MAHSLPQSRARHGAARTDWQALLIAADWILGDHGSLSAYGTLTEAALLLTSDRGVRFPRSRRRHAWPL
ncbi:hypothetical protein [Streptomyces lydicus]|uniref:hypothetical protein n=1 Tax=Streptomyces lydicus TaxID=47763 RepID=UPI0036ED8CB5